MQRQPRTPQEAAMLDPLGLMSFPAPNIPRGIFGSGRRRFNTGYTPGRDGSAGASGGVGMSPPLDPASAPGMSPPSISEAPPPPADWKKTLGSALVSRLGSMDGGLQIEPMTAAPPMRAPTVGDAGLFGSPNGLPGKIANRGALIDANGLGKKGFDWRMVAGIVGDALLGLNGQQPLYAMTRIKENQAQADSRRRLAEMAQEWQYRNNQPDYATVGNRRFAFNPATGQAQTLYVAPSEAEDYAAALGAEPGTEEYNTLVSDYVLRHSGPTATANAMQEEDNRQTNRVGLEGVRQQNRLGIEGVRQGNRLQLRGTPTYRDNNPRPSTARSGGGKGGIREGQTATNPQTGAKVIYRGGKWVPAR